jgi:TrmH family RNA methyltransferase
MTNNPIITSLHNEKVKLARALQTAAKQRRKAGLMVLEGARLVRDALQAGHHPAFVLVAPNAIDPALLTELQTYYVETLPVSDEVMRHVSDTQQPQGILAVFPMPSPSIPSALFSALILDSIRDPGNLGTMLRTAAAAGVDAVLLSPTCADPYNPKTLRGGMGAHFRVPVIEAGWPQITAACAKMSVYLADSRGNCRYDAADWSGAWALIIGSEAHGAGDEARQLARTRLYIPMAAETESLNAAVAAGIILFEAVHGRR